MHGRERRQDAVGAPTDVDRAPGAESGAASLATLERAELRKRLHAHAGHG
jgi:hypothetical protein